MSRRQHAEAVLRLSPIFELKHLQIFQVHGFRRILLRGLMQMSVVFVQQILSFIIFQAKTVPNILDPSWLLLLMFGSGVTWAFSTMLVPSQSWQWLMGLLIQIIIYINFRDFLLLRWSISPVWRWSWSLCPRILISFDICCVFLCHLIQLDDTVEWQEVLNNILG